MTLNEIARELELSPSTISRALNRPDLVSAATRAKVLAAVEAHGYRPNAIARSLRQGGTRTVGMIVSDIQNPFYAAVVKAVESALAEQGYTLVVCNADEDARTKASALASLAELRVAAVIHAPTGEDPGLLEEMRDRGVAVIEIDRSSGIHDVDSVLVDNHAGAAAAARHLLELGHRRLAVVSGPLHATTGERRLAGFRDALAAAGVSLPDAYVEIGDFREASGHRAARRLLALREPPTALFVANNEMAAGALGALREAGLRLPEQMSLVAFDDARWMRFVTPPLTAVGQPTEEIGRLAAELCLERIAGRRDVRRHLLSPTFVPRDSCAPPAASSR